MIELDHVKKVYGGRSPRAYTAVDGVSLSIGWATVVAIRGPQGSGKTTLLSLIGCMTQPTEGRVLLDGLDVTALALPAVAKIRRWTFGVIPRSFGLMEGASVLENVMLPAWPTGLARWRVEATAHELLERLEMKDWEGVNAEALPPHAARRAALARALINNPRVLIMDEPTDGVENRWTPDFMKTVAVLRSQGKSVLIASNDPEVYGAPMIDGLIDMHGGRLAGRVSLSGDLFPVGA